MQTWQTFNISRIFFTPKFSSISNSTVPYEINKNLHRFERFKTLFFDLDHFVCSLYIHDKCIWLIFLFICQVEKTETIEILHYRLYNGNEFSELIFLLNWFINHLMPIYFTYIKFKWISAYEIVMYCILLVWYIPWC